MQITEVRIKLAPDNKERLLAFASITFDGCWVTRDLKIIDGNKGTFIAMPSRKLTDRCPDCKCKNPVQANFCSRCGIDLPPDRAKIDEAGHRKLYADIAHPISSAYRSLVEKAVLDEYDRECKLAKEPGYACRYYYDDETE